LPGTWQVGASSPIAAGPASGSAVSNRRWHIYE
jgi:hypothetical protein